MILLDKPVINTGCSSRTLQGEKNPDLLLFKHQVANCKRDPEVCKYNWEDTYVRILFHRGGKSY